MENNFITEIFVAICGVITTFVGYRAGKKKSDNEAMKVLLETYNFAIESLRKEFESRISLLQKENEELRKEIEELRKKK